MYTKVRFTLDIMKVVAFIVTIILASQGLISWWVAVLLVLWSMEVKVTL